MKSMIGKTAEVPEAWKIPSTRWWRLNLGEAFLYDEELPPDVLDPSF